MSARRTVRWVAAIAAVATLGGVLSASAAGAAVGAKVSAADCETLLGLGENIDTVSGSGANVFGKQAAALADGLDETAKDIKNKKLRKSLTSMADFYDELADADNLIEAGKVAASESRKYGKALKVYTKTTLKCVTTQISLPTDFTLPK